MLALVERVVAAVERLLALHDAVLENANLLFALRLLGLGGLLVLDDLLLGLEQGFLLEGLCGALGIGDDLLGFAVGALYLGFRFAHAAVLGVAHDQNGHDGAKSEASDADEHRHDGHGYSLGCFKCMEPPPAQSGRQDICRIWSTKGDLKSVR